MSLFRFYMLLFTCTTLLQTTLFATIHTPQEKQLSFTKEELAFIKKQQPIRYVFDPNWEPFEYKDRIQRHRGIIADILKIVQTKTSLNLIAVPTDTWKESVELVRSKQADMFSAINETKERKKSFVFTKNTLFSYKAVLLKRKDDAFDYTRGDIRLCCKNKTVGVVRGYVLEEYFKKLDPSFTIVLFDSTTEGFNALRDKKIDLFAINDVTANYFIYYKGYNTVTLARQLSYLYSLKIALRNDMPPVVLSILDKALGTISKSELDVIYEKWVNVSDVQIQQQTYKNITVGDIIPIKQIAVIVLGIFFLTIFIFKFLKKRRDIPLTIPVFTIVGLFLISIIFVTLISVKNLERLKKEEFGHSLSALLNSTHEAVKKLLTSQQELLSVIIEDETQDLEEFSKKFVKLKEKVRFIRDYVVVDTSNKVQTAWNKKLVGTVITNPNITDAIQKARKFGWHFLVPYRDSPKEFWHLFYIQALIDKATLQPKGAILIGLEQKVFQSILEKGRMGKTGEIYVVNKNKTIISNSRFEEELIQEGLLKRDQHAFLNITVDTLATKKALLKQNGLNTQGYLDYRNTPVYGAWEWNNDLDIAIISEIDKNEAMHSFEQLKNTIYYAIFGISGFVVLLMVFITWLSNKRRKELMRFNVSLERKVQKRTKELEDEKLFVQTLLNSQEQIILTSNGIHLVSVNKAFYDFFDVESIEAFELTYKTHCICDLFEKKEGFLQKNMGDTTWIDYIIANSSKVHKVILKKENQEYVFSVTGVEIQEGENIKLAVFTDITLLEEAKKEVEAINKRTKESIEYASLIQSALIPDDKNFYNYFSDFFAYWEPKDTVGGDIYLFEELRKDEDCLLMMIDCTGHGVPGAFVTMLVKAIERQVVLKLKHENIEVNPAKILGFFNKTMKHLLNQENKNNISNAGFDGGILYYNKKEQVVKYAGAQTPLFYIQNDTLHTIKGDRYSVGYKKCSLDYKYSEHVIHVEKGMKFYLSSDGYLDQNGGKKGFPFGKKRLMKLIEEYHKVEMNMQKAVFVSELRAYQKDYERNDDITLLAIEV